MVGWSFNRRKMSVTHIAEILNLRASSARFFTSPESKSRWNSSAQARSVTMRGGEVFLGFSRFFRCSRRTTSLGPFF